MKATKLLHLWVTGLMSMASSITGYGQLNWHFEYAQGLPVKLVWQTQPGQTCNLQTAAELPAWTPVPGFPKVASGTAMEHPFTPGTKGFFQISLATAAGGWQLVPVPALPAGDAYQFRAVSALPPHHVWVGGVIQPGYDDFVVRSANGGTGWTQIFRSGGMGFFGELQMVTPEVGYAAGGGLWRTADGGASWQPDQGNFPDPPGTWHNVGPDGYVYGMAVVDAGHVWTAGYDGASAGVIYHRVPERPQPDPGNPNVNTPWWLEWAETARGMYGVAAVDATTAWAVGYAGYIWKTVDGKGWGKQTSPTSVPLHDVVAIDASTAWVVGDAGTILKTTDGGDTWQVQASNTTENLRRLAAIDASVAWAVGGGGVILRTTDGGATWTRQLTGTTAPLHGVAALDATTAWVAGDGGTLLRTTDGGAGSWPAPTLAGVTPNRVGVAGWPTPNLTLQGTGFRGGNLTVEVDGQPASGVVWINETTVQISAPRVAAGLKDVTLINEDGQRTTLPSAVLFMPEPILTRYRPWHAPATGGFVVTLDGFNLQSVQKATLKLPGYGEELPVTVVDSTRITVSVPESSTRPTGPADLELDTAEHQFASAGSILLDPPEGPSLAVSSIAPDSGVAWTTATVTGVGFSTNATLDVCWRDMALTSRSSTELVGQVGGDAGPGRLYLQNSETDTISVEPAFLLFWEPVPTVAQLTPNTGPAGGGVTVTLTGTGFRDGDTVTFDGYPAEVLTRTATSMVLTVPPHPPGTVSVIVMTEDLERSAAVLPGAFTYQ